MGWRFGLIWCVKRAHKTPPTGSREGRSVRLFPLAFPVRTPAATRVACCGRPTAAVSLSFAHFNVLSISDWSRCLQATANPPATFRWVGTNGR